MSLEYGRNQPTCQKICMIISKIERKLEHIKYSKAKCMKLTKKKRPTCPNGVGRIIIIVIFGHFGLNKVAGRCYQPVWVQIRTSYSSYRIFQDIALWPTHLQTTQCKCSLYIWGQRSVLIAGDWRSVNKFPLYGTSGPEFFSGYFLLHFLSSFNWLWESEHKSFIAAGPQQSQGWE